MEKNIKFGERRIGNNNPCYIIAEIGVNFNGDLGLAKQMIDAAANCGADAVKFQTFKADEFVADKSLTYTYKENGKQITETQYEMFKRLELPDAWHAILQDHARQCGVDFLSSTADRAAVDLLMRLEVPVLKLASEDLINVELLEYVAGKGRPVILSTGMADRNEIEYAVDLFRRRGHCQIVLLHCTSTYPTPPKDCNLRKITTLQNTFPCPVGFSDHSEGADAAVIAVALGAVVVEKHFTLDKTLPGPDHSMSADPQIFSEMVRKIRLTERMLGKAILMYGETETEGRNRFRRSIVAARFIAAGTIIQEEMLTYKRPGNGLKPYQRELIIGRQVVRDIHSDEMIQLEDIGEE